MQTAYILDIKEIAKEFKEKNEKLRSRLGALLIEAFTAKTPLLYNEYGKPYKNKPPYFNVSHSKDKVGIFVSDNAEVGFDIQYIKEYNEKLKDYVFNEEEKKGVDNGVNFAVRWAMREAAAKCVGVGLRNFKTQTLKDITAETFIFGNEKLYYKNHIDGDYAVSLCSYNKIDAKVLHLGRDFVLKTLAKNVENSI